MITKDIALILGWRDILHHKTLKNADGTPVRCRVNGKCKTWKRDPDAYQLPVKYALKTCFYIAPGNQDEWEFPELQSRLATIAGLAYNAPAYAIRDKLIEEGKENLGRLLDTVVAHQVQELCHG